jgi:hypothetical protein
MRWSDIFNFYSISIHPYRVFNLYDVTYNFCSKFVESVANTVYTMYCSIILCVYYVYILYVSLCSNTVNAYMYIPVYTYLYAYLTPKLPLQGQCLCTLTYVLL